MIFCEGCEWLKFFERVGNRKEVSKQSYGHEVGYKAGKGD